MPIRSQAGSKAIEFFNPANGWKVLIHSSIRSISLQLSNLTIGLTSVISSLKTVEPASF
ncbi:hypothetical protein [Chamaesiphon sp. GL140_3_metabinner_50]|uniref:hypothetical protein n=1 Tax=Chamaesiphon sp. GL140_3_metabinner_50 TaxID=2970812 RepID=UPI0025E2FC9F|nr:hypothetical protein [Chamaesiphon sp. GL140_3_metabinner_50]